MVKRKVKTPYDNIQFQKPESEMKRNLKAGAAFAAPGLVVGGVTAGAGAAAGGAKTGVKLAAKKSRKIKMKKAARRAAATESKIEPVKLEPEGSGVWQYFEDFDDWLKELFTFE